MELKRGVGGNVYGGRATARGRDRGRGGGR